MRIAIAGLFEEVNTFAVETMGLARITGNFATGFQKFEGKDLLAAGGPGTSNAITGFLNAFHAAGNVDVVPAVTWMFGAGPTIEGATYAKLSKTLLESLKASLPLDGIALYIHGAGVAEGVDCVEEDLIAHIRELVGPDCRVVASTDHHSNLTERTREMLDFLTVVKHYPHIDWEDIAHRAGAMLVALIGGKTKTYGHFERLPFLMQALSTMEGNPFAPIRKKVESYAKRRGIHEFSLNYGFAFADVPTNTATVNCWAESPELARKTAREFAGWLWKNRARFVVRPSSAAEAVDRALALLARQGRIEKPAVEMVIAEPDLVGMLAAPTAEQAAASGFLPDDGRKGPVVVAEMSDNPGCGAPGDATHVLWELLRRGAQQAAVCSIRDPETVKQAMKAGVGKIITVRLGGKRSKRSGKPIKAKAYVKSISDGVYTNVSDMYKGARIDLGPAVGLLIEGVSVAVVSGIGQPFDARQMELLGFDPRDYRIVVVKSANHFRAWWSTIAAAIVDADPPGIASNNLATFTYKRKVGSVYPLDSDARWPAKTA
jgi:microcystin degradation protein MlrC